MLYSLPLYSTEDGKVYLCDSKMPGQTVFTIHAHDSGIPGLSLSTHVPGCLATGSPDGTLKIWDIAGNKPSHVLTKDLGIVCRYDMVTECYQMSMTQLFGSISFFFFDG